MIDKIQRLFNLIVFKRVLPGVLACCLAGVGLVGAQEPPETAAPVANPNVLLKTASGRITVELFPQNAPLMVNFFLAQVKKGSYNRLPFKRYADGFAIQLAQPKKTSTPVMSDERNNGLSHVQGTVGLVWDYVSNTNGNKLYICLSAVPQLDNKHTIIGKIVDGLEVLSELRPGDKLEKISLIKQHSVSKAKRTK